MRNAHIVRQTKETAIDLTLSILPAGELGNMEGTTGIGFFDHMLCSFAVHGSFSLSLELTSDLFVDGHHTVEDVGICLGQAIAKAAGDKTGIARFADIILPMDEALVLCALDVSGRPYLCFDAAYRADRIGQYDTQLTKEFFYALAQHAGTTLHLKKLYGENDHHVTEAMFKAAGICFQRALYQSGNAIPSAKGSL